MRSPSKRPAFAGMGLWKWPALALLLFSLGMLIPYGQNAGSPPAHSQEPPLAGEIVGCEVVLRIRLSEQTARVGGAIDSGCARRIASMTLRLLDAQGELVAERPLNGNPNALNAAFWRYDRPCASSRIELVVVIDDKEELAFWDIPPRGANSAEC